MSTYRIAGFNIRFENKYPYTDKLCADYRHDCTKVDYVISTTDKAINDERALVGDSFSLGYCEATCLYRALCNQILFDDAFLLHGAVVAVDGKGYAFLGKSGAGKSTHAMLWKQFYPDSVTIINGDKPIVRRLDGQFIAFGTPWSGKEQLNTNAGAPLQSLCFIEQARSNQICRLSMEETIARYFHQLLIPKDKDTVSKLLELTDAFLESMPAYLLHCDISKEAVDLCFNTLTNTR